MTTSAEVDAAWAAKIWSHPTVQGFTDKVFSSDPPTESQFDLAKLRSAADSQGPRINFFLCVVQRRQEPNQVAGGGTDAGSRYTFRVRVEYYLQQTDQPEETALLHRDRLEAVDDLVRMQLRGRWNDTVDYWQGGVPLDPTKVTIDTRTCWKGGFTYTAFKSI